MLSYNKNMYSFFNCIITFFLFYLIFIFRYQTNIFESTTFRPITINTFIMFFSYSVIITILNIAMKLYEFNKLYSIKNSIFYLYLVSIITALSFGLFFYISKVDFARFVFFTGLILNPIILTLFNKFFFRFLFPYNRNQLLFYIGEEKDFIYIKELVDKYKKILNIQLIKINSQSNINVLIDDNTIIVIDENSKVQKEYVKLLTDYELNGGMIYTITDLYDYLDESIPSNLIMADDFKQFSSYKINNFYSKYLKRIGDIVISIILLILTLPVLLITALIIKITSKGPIIYFQSRVGQKGIEFNMYKFRTMVKNAETDKALLTTKHDSRVTSIGKIMRPFRIDELPQLFNILKGDMSFIGPRPERKEIIDQILDVCPLFNKRLLVKPGLTGWAQVKFKYIDDIHEMHRKLDYDLYYIKNISLLIDLKIVLYTIETILFRRGAL